MFDEAEDKNFLPSKPVVKLLHQGKNFPRILWLCKSKGTYVNPSDFKALVSIFTPPTQYLMGYDRIKMSGIYFPNLFQILVVIIR